MPTFSMLRSAPAWLLVFGLCWVNSVAAKDEYSQGMTAYIERDYELAQSLWLQAAKQDHARAMFNLGLLHQQGRLINSDPEKASRWFRLAGQAGYAAADYHHAMWLQSNGGSEADIQRYLRRAAEGGYKPAQGRLLSSSAQVSSVVSGRQTEPTGTGQTPLQLNYLSEDWLLTKPASAWTIQLLAFTEEDKVREFIDLHRLHDRAAYFSEQDGQQRLYKLVYGEFESKEAADVARAELKQALREHGPWLRTMASVQGVIRTQ